ncbi:hypothetical protein D6777_00340 [Candidatus Woesearchaeota archaeon]|nr:MAG: hypothetical protein D6777_00340 [Candidatus Woesearchaeota archaeon]
MNTIKKIFNNEVDEVVHHKFTRYGKGEFERFLIKVKKGKSLQLNTSWDWSNDLFELVAFNVSEDVDLSGKVIAGRDFESELSLEPVKYSKRGKLYTAEFKCKASPSQLQELYEKFKLNFILLKVKSSSFKLSCGSSLPKPGGEIKDNFCKATLPLDLLDEFVWESSDFKVATIVHKFKIEDIVIPDEYKNDPAMARLKGKRVGTLTRSLDLDGKESSEDIRVEL